MTQTSMGNYEASWGQYGADEWSDAMVASMKLGGVDNLFFVSGSEIAFWQESIAKAKEREWPAPRLVTVTHEGVALNAAAGDAMVSGKPSATAVHVDVGTLNFGAAIHTVWRGSYPVLMTAGTGPRGFPGSMTGGRDSPVQWVQEPRDQGEIVRQYTKVDHRLEHQDNPGMMISRLLQVAMSEPKGPVYLTVPRETAMQRLPGVTRFPTRDEMGLARPAWPDPADARRAAEWLIKANNPLLCLAKSGRNPESVEHVVRLAELLALPVAEGHTDRLNFPTTHPLFGTGPAPKDADALLVMESPIPYSPGMDSPQSSAKVIWVDVDPVFSRYKTMEHRADLWLPVSTVGAAQAIYEAATSLLTAGDISRIADRRARLEERKREQVAAAEETALKAGQRRPIHPRWVAYQLGKILEPDTILLDDALSSAPLVQTYRARTQPSTYFKSGGSSGGWGSGAAFGAKLARPQSDVILATGDGYFMFGTPMAALWAAAHHGAPFMSVVFVNRSYSTGTRGLISTYPDGSAANAGNYDGGLFDPPPDFAKMAEAANSYGETVTEPEEVGPALRRGLEHVRNGTPAVLAVMLPTLVEEMSL
ncbi:MAG: thiamine pyrophosphate-requiring protein [Dehalococcoidia bacterium]|nr:thiamine pyrophosphate-requiring protein [Dehalococcoidia bacterium]MEE2926930.1 thiamine pyrophosphate-requiring protein [Chloroflexota bacterium]